MIRWPPRRAPWPCRVSRCPQVQRDQVGRNAGRLAGLENRGEILDAGDDGLAIQQGAAKADEQALPVRTDFQRLDIQPTLGLHIQDFGCRSKLRMRRHQRRFQLPHQTVRRHATTLDAKAHSLSRAF